jgi:hypothetical protein
MTTFGRLIIAFVLLAAALIGISLFARPGASAPQAPATSTAKTYGMAQYQDAAHGFSFWYPDSLSVTASTTHDATSFPGGVADEILAVGPGGGVSLTVVESPKGTITDEPENHASPIPATKYFYDAQSGWMVTYPEGAPRGDMSGATTTANISKTTIGGLPMLPSGRRFDTSIIPLSTTRFLVVSDGGGSAFTNELAKTVSLLGTPVDTANASTALQAEAAAYERQ